MKGYSTLLLPLELQPCHQIQISVIPKTPPMTRGTVPNIQKGIQSMYSKLHPQGEQKSEKSTPGISKSQIIISKFKFLQIISGRKKEILERILTEVCLEYNFFVSTEQRCEAWLASRLSSSTME